LNASAGPASDLAAKMPADSPAATAAACEALLATGEAGLLELCGALRPPGDEAGLPARYALGSLALHASRPGADAQRRLYTGALAKGLAAAADVEVKRFILGQLQLAGGDDWIPAATTLLKDPALCDDAVAALEDVASPAADAALAKALAGGSAAKPAAVILALGRRGAKSAAPAIAARAQKGDPSVDAAALAALSKLGLPDSAALVAALATPGPDAAETARRSALRLAYVRGLAADGHAKAAIGICREIVAAGMPAARIDAMDALAAISFRDAIPVLQEAVGANDIAVSRAALRRLGAIDDPSVGPWLASRFATAAPELRADILCTLRLRGDKAGAPLVEAGLADTNEVVVTAAAVAAAALLPVDRQAPTLLAALGPAAATPARTKPIVDALGRLPGDAPTAAAADALPGAASADVKKAILQVLAARRGAVARGAVLKAMDDADATVRTSAVQALAAAGTPQDLPRLVAVAVRAADPEAAAARKSLVAISGDLPADARAGAALDAWASADAAARGKLLSVLGALGGPAAMAKVVATLGDADAALREAALRALAGWSAPEAAPKLLELATAAEPPTLRIVALRGAIRLSRDASANARDRLAWIDAALKAATRADEKREAVSALAELDSPPAVARAAGLLDDPDVPREAALALARMLVPEKARKGAKLSATDIAALRKALPHLPAGDVKSRVEKALPK
jgi:HEAT repeat protein